MMAGLTSALAERGHELVLITLDDAGSDRHAVHRDVVRMALGVMRDSRGGIDSLVNTRRRLWAIRAAVSASRPDVVLSFCDRTNVSVLAAMLGTSIPVVVAERSDPAQQHLGRWWERARRLTYRRASRVIALTETAAAHLRQLSPRPVEVIPSAIEAPPNTSDRAVAVANQQVIAMGRLAPEKGFKRLLDAFATATIASPGWSLRILGEGPERGALEKRTEQHRLGDRVSLPGWVRPVWGELARSTLFVLPSHYEGFPSALLEAMAVGVPSLAVDCDSGPRAIIEHDVNGYLVANNTAALAEGMLSLMHDVDKRERLGAAGRSVLERFSWPSMVAAYERVLTDASAGRSTGHTHQPSLARGKP